MHTTDIPVSESSLLRRVEVFLEDGEFDRADEYCERVLDINVENGCAYLYKLLARLELKSKSELQELCQPIDVYPEYTKIMRFADISLKKEVEDINADIKEKIELSRKQECYAKAVSLIESDELTALTEAYSLFTELDTFNDSKKLAENCEEKIESFYDSRYNQLYLFIKDKEQEINGIRYQNKADLAERDNYSSYINDNHSKKVFDFSVLITLCVIIVCILGIVFSANDFLNTAGIEFKTVVRCIFTRIIPGIPITTIASIITFSVSKKLVRKQKANRLEDIGTAAERARLIDDKIRDAEAEIITLQKELDASLDAMRKLNSEYDIFAEKKKKDTEPEPSV